MQIIVKNINEIEPYANNPRLNEDAVPALMESIKQFGWKVPIVIDRNNVIVAGHTRYKAAQRLKIKDIPCIVADDLTDDQIKAYRLADNKIGEIAQWDFDALHIEMEDIEMDMTPFGFGDVVEFGNLESMMEDEIDEEHQAFLDKFKEKYTTDDCFTPPEVYEVVKEWVLKTYGIDRKRAIVRPFYPGGDYQSFSYPKNCIVIDNPPFSIHAQICRFYVEKGIDFFLFANGLTCLNGLREGKIRAVIAHTQIVYENGADINTAFLTNLGEDDIIVSGELHELVDKAQPRKTAELNAYSFPDNLVTAAMLGRLAFYGSNFTIKNVKMIDRLDDGTNIFGKGALISDVKAEKVKAEKVKIPVLLSEREREWVESLNQLDGLIE